MMSRNVLVISLLILLLIPSVAMAADCPCTIDTLGTGSSRSLGDSGGSEIGRAQTFIAPGNGQVSGFKVQFGFSVNSPTGDITWVIAGDYLGQPGATVISGTFTPVANSTVTVTVGSGVNLNSGGQYWLTLRAPNQTTDSRYVITAATAASSYSGGIAWSSTNNAAWVSDASADLFLIMTLGQVVATSTPTATAATATPADTLTPTITPSPTPNYLIQVTSTAGAPMALERTATYGDLTTFGGLLIVAGVLFFIFVYTYWRDRARASVDS